MSRFIKYNPDSEMSNYLESKPIANHLANIIAKRVRRTDCKFTNLKTNQCYLGDYKKIGLTEKQYRTAKKELERIGFATFKGTNKGTVATLVSIEVWDVNTEVKGGQRADDETDKGRLTKNEKNIKYKYIPIYKEIVAFFTELTGKSIRVANTDDKILKQDNYKLAANRLKNGAYLHEMKRVIELKFNEWKGTKDEKYIRFETLFANKNYQKYLNELDNYCPTPEATPIEYDLEKFYIEEFGAFYPKVNPTEFKRDLELFEEAKDKLSQIADSYSNPSIDVYFLWLALYKPLGARLQGVKPDQKLKGFQYWFNGLTNWQQNKADLKNLLREYNKKHSLV